jgi:hypothetical protein
MAAPLARPLTTRKTPAMITHDARRSPGWAGFAIGRDPLRARLRHLPTAGEARRRIRATYLDCARYYLTVSPEARSESKKIFPERTVAPLSREPHRPAAGRCERELKRSRQTAAPRWRA